MEKETINEKPSSLKISLSFLISVTYIIFGYILYSEYPGIANFIKILGVIGILVTFFYISIKITTWPEKFQSLIQEYFLLWFEIAYTLLFISIIAFTIRFFIIQPFSVKGDSMEPSFKNGEYLIVNEISYRLGKKPKRGDVIVFKFPKDLKENYIKRIIGLPEEKVKINSGKIYIYDKKDSNGIELQESYIPDSYETQSDTNQEWDLNNNEYFVMGDNRLPGGSSDSRHWGILPRKNIIGKVWFVFWPPREAGFISLPQYNF